MVEGCRALEEDVVDCFESSVPSPSVTLSSLLFGSGIGLKKLPAMASFSWIDLDKMIRFAVGFRKEEPFVHASSRGQWRTNHAIVTGRRIATTMVGRRRNDGCCGDDPILIFCCCGFFLSRWIRFHFPQQACVVVLVMILSIIGMALGTPSELPSSVSL